MFCHDSKFSKFSKDTFESWHTCMKGYVMFWNLEFSFVRLQKPNWKQSNENIVFWICGLSAERHCVDFPFCLVNTKALVSKELLSFFVLIRSLTFSTYSFSCLWCRLIRRFSHICYNKIVIVISIYRYDHIQIVMKWCIIKQNIPFLSYIFSYSVEHKGWKNPNQDRELSLEILESLFLWQEKIIFRSFCCFFVHNPNKEYK